MTTRALQILALIGTLASPAAAQTGSRISVHALGGVTFVTETSAAVGGGVTIAVHPHVQLLGEMGRLTNIMPKSVQRDLDAVVPQLAPLFGSSLSIDGQLGGVYGVAGARFVGTAVHRTAAFAELALGGVRLATRIHATSATGDVSAPVTTTLGVPGPEIHPMMLLGAGAAIDVHTRVVVDVGYRYMRVWPDDPRVGAINSNAVYSAIHLRF
jgi:hypothetical protein